MILTVRESLRRLHYRLIRLKLLSEHNFGQLTFSDRLLHIRPLSALVLSAPALLFMLWYSGLAISTHLRQKTAVSLEEPLTAELFQLHLHDRLVADVRRLTMSEARVRSELPTYNLVISNDKLTQLDANLPPDEGRAGYVGGFLEHKNHVYEIDVRYRGTKHWHWNNPQKSWKIRVKPEHLMFEGLPTFNFINTPDPMPFNEQMVLDVARDAGLLTPAYYPFRLQLNRAFLGVYFFEAQADEGLLRRARRMTGSIYSGAGAPTNPDTQVSRLWESTKHWKKVGAVSAEDEKQVSELEGLINAVNRSSARGFAEYAETNLDLEKFATFDAIDVAFGNNQHDFHQNHKLYFDPYKNRFEPIATDFRDMEHEREFNRTENPLLLRLKQLPDYLSRRNRKVYELITGLCSTKALTDLTRHWTELLAPDQARDPYWDAYELLPVMGTYYRQLVRPMTEERQALAAQMRLHDHDLRVAYLRGELERLDVAAALLVPHAAPAARPAKKTASAANEITSIVDVTVKGPAAFELGEATTEFPAGCASSEWQLWADRDLDQKLSVEHDLRLLAVAPPLHSGKADITLYPGVSLRPITANQFRGRVRAEVQSRTYRFYVRSSGCAPQRVVLAGRNTATLAPITLSAELRDTLPALEATHCDDGAGFAEPGSQSPHPFCYPFEGEETLHLGPGTVELKKTRTYSKYQTLVIEPGTTIHASGKGTIIAYGKVIAEGRPDAKIRFEARDGHWGGLALQGPGTAGSRFSQVEFTAGTKPDRASLDFPGMVNLHDSRDIQLSFVSFSNNEESEDALHVAYVDGLVLNDVTFTGAPVDAIDITYSVAKLKRVTVVGAGNDCLELMGSRAEVIDSKFVRCQENALSVGEHSEVTATRTLMARGGRAIWLKNASSLTASELLVHTNNVAVRLESESLWYAGASNLRLDDAYLVQTPKRVDGSAANVVGQFLERLGERDLDGLRRDVIEVPEWSALDVALDRLEQRRAQ